MEGTAAKRPRTAHRNYSSFGGAITKMVHDRKAGISNKAMRAFDSITRDLTIKLTTEASRLAEMDHRITVKPRDIETATKLLLPGELGDRAAAKIAPAVSKVIAARPARKPKA